MAQLFGMNNIRSRLTAAFLALVLAGSTLLLPGTANTAHAAGKMYEVGPGRAYAQISDVPIEKLGPGDTVRIHWRQQPYKEIIAITSSGTAEAPITIQGVPGPQGQLPVLDANGATLDSSIRTAYYGTPTRGLIIIANRPEKPGENLWGYKPSHIVIEGLDLRGAHRDHTFYTESTGETRRFANAAAAVFVERGEYITIRGNVVHDNGNGLFVASGGSEEMISRNILIENNYLYDNGNVGSDQQHQTYTEAGSRIIYQYNVFGSVKAGSGGNQLKDRSSGTIIRYNTFRNGAHAMDLVEAEDGLPVLGREPSYLETFVYGNTILNDGLTGSIVHYGGDLGDYRKGTLYFYNNTVVAINDQARKWRHVLFQIEPGSKVDFRNNIVYSKSATAGAAPSAMVLSGSSGMFNIGKNWVSPGTMTTRGDEYYTGTYAGAGNLIAIPNNDPGFVDLPGGDYRLRSDSGAVDLGESLDFIPESMRVHNQHIFNIDAKPGVGLNQKLGRVRPQGDTALDFGAFEIGVADQENTAEPNGFASGREALRRAVLVNDPPPYHPEEEQPAQEQPQEEQPSQGQPNDNGGTVPSDPAPVYTVDSFFGAARELSFTSGNGKAEVVGSDTIKFSQFSNAWSTPRQIAFQSPIPITGNRLELDVFIDGTSSASVPTTLLFYFNGSKDAQHWVGTGSLKLGDKTRITLDLSAIASHLGGSISQIGVYSGYGWPTDSSVQLSHASFASAGGQATATNPAPTAPSANPTPAPASGAGSFTDGGAGTAEIVQAGGSTGYKFSQFPNAWAVPKQLKLSSGISLDNWKAGDRLVLDMRVEGTAANTNPTTLLFYFNGGKDDKHWVGTDKLQLGQTQTISLDLSRIVGNLSGQISQIGILTGYGWPAGASVTISNIKRVTGQ